jgi:hypothetical protein
MCPALGGAIVSPAGGLLDRPRLLGLFGAVPIVGGVVILLVRAAFLHVDLLRPPFAALLIASLIAWPLVTLVLVGCAAIARPATFKVSLRRGGITGAIAATSGWVAVVALIEGLFSIDAKGVHRSMSDPEEWVRGAPYLLPVVALVGFWLGGFAAVAASSGRRLAQVLRR